MGKEDFTGIASSTQGNIEQRALDLSELLLDCNPQLEVAEAMVKAAELPEDLRLLLARAPNLRLSQDILDVISLTNYNKRSLVSQLLKHDKNLRVTQAALLLYGDCDTSYLETLLDHDSELEIGEEAFSAILGSIDRQTDVQQLVDFLSGHQKKIPFSDPLQVWRGHLDRMFPGPRFMPPHS